MTPKLWAVVPIGDDLFRNAAGPTGQAGILPKEQFMDHILFFGQENRANDYASMMASVNGGRQYLVLQPQHVFHATASPLKMKSWLNGELVPV